MVLVRRHIDHIALLPLLVVRKQLQDNRRNGEGRSNGVAPSLSDGRSARETTGGAAAASAAAPPRPGALPLRSRPITYRHRLAAAGYFLSLASLDSDSRTAMRS